MKTRGTVEAVDAETPERAALSASTDGPESLGRVLHHGHAPGVGVVADGLDPARAAERVHWHDRRDPPAG